MRTRRGDFGGVGRFIGGVAVCCVYYFGHQINVAKVAGGEKRGKCGMLVGRGQLASGGGSALQHIQRNSDKK